MKLVAFTNEQIHLILLNTHFSKVPRVLSSLHGDYSIHLIEEDIKYNWVWVFSLGRLRWNVLNYRADHTA